MLPDVRSRAVTSLAFKLRERIITVHDVVQELPSLDAFFNTVFPELPADVETQPELAPLNDLIEAAYILEHLAKHPFGYHWLHQRQGLQRMTAYKTMLSRNEASLQLTSFIERIDAVVAALLSLPVGTEPPQVPDWAPTTPLAAAKALELAAAESPEQWAAARTEDVTAVDLLQDLGKADCHDDFLKVLWQLHEKCTADATAAHSICQEGRWETAFAKFIKVRAGSPAHQALSAAHSLIFH